MNAQLKRKCDKLITQAENGTLLYGNIINEIAKNKKSICQADVIKIYPYNITVFTCDYYTLKECFL